MIVALKRNYIHNLCVSLLCFSLFFLELYDNYTEAKLKCATNLPFVRILLKKTNRKSIWGKKTDTCHLWVYMPSCHWHTKLQVKSLFKWPRMQWNVLSAKSCCICQSSNVWGWRLWELLQILFTNLSYISFSPIGVPSLYFNMSHSLLCIMPKVFVVVFNNSLVSLKMKYNSAIFVTCAVFLCHLEHSLGPCPMSKNCSKPWPEPIKRPWLASCQRKCWSM